MLAQAREWFEHNTSTAGDWPLDDLLTAKGDTRVDVILPARNEEHTVGGIVADVRDNLMAPEAALVDDLVVVDSASTDATAAEAAAAGARVVADDSVLQDDVPGGPGKGDALWRGVAATSGDLVVFVDADLRSFAPHYVMGLLGPLLRDPAVQLVKAVYDRPLVSGEARIPSGGGRVTEILARPLINALWPELAGIAQPLSGEYAARRSLLQTLPFPSGYGVEIALLVDTYRRVGLPGLAQVDLGEREHRHQDSSDLSRMSAQVLHAAMVRADPRGDVHQRRQVATLPSYRHGADGFTMSVHEIQTDERPPLVSVPGYRR